MKFEETYDFDYPVDVIMTMFGDESYYLRKYERLDGRSAEHIATTQGKDEFEITVRYGFGTEEMNLPDMIRSRMPKKVDMLQTDRWDLTANHGRIDIDFEKTPANVAIDMRLKDNGGKARMTLGFNIKVEVPMLGGRVEKAISGPLTRRVWRDLDISNEMAEEYAAK